MIDLTDAQKKVMLQLGDTESNCEAIPLEILEELIQLGLVYRRAEDHIDFTDSGEAVYDELIEQN